MINTICNDCYFAQPTTSDKPCVFNIPNIVQEYKNIETYQGYNIIKNYNCRYGFSKKIYNEHIDKLSSLDMQEYVKQQNIVKYSIGLIVETEDSFESCVDSINRLSIKPSYITIICYADGNKLYDLLKSNLKFDIDYKVHNFLENISGPRSLHIALETNKNKVGNLIWLLNYDSLTKVVENDSIQNINYIINVEQKPAHYYKCSSIDSQFYGIFINMNNYINLSSKNDYLIENSPNVLTINYD